MRTGLIKEVFMMAIDSIRTNKLRSFLTILGIVIGILTIVSMVSVIEGINNSFSQQIQSMGSNVLFITRFEPGIHVGGFNTEELRRRKRVTVEDALAIKEKCPSVLSATPRFSYFRLQPPLKAKYRENEVESPQVFGVSHDFLQIFEFYSIQDGRFFTEAENRNSSDVCVIGAELKDTLFPTVSALGKLIILDSKKMIVVGTLTRQGKFLGENRDNALIMPFKTFQSYYPKWRGMNIVAKVRSTATLDEAKNEIINLLRTRRRIKSSQNNNFSVYSQDTLSGLFDQLTGAAFAVMIIISSIALVVGGIGVMNIMLVSVKERTREIGLRKALGAKRSEIRRQFLYEAMILTGTGGIIGMILGILISMAIKKLTGLPIAINLVSLLSGFLTSSAVGLFFGIYPASQAANLNPVDALRYE